jgi:hypothetical protein
VTRPACPCRRSSRRSLGNHYVAVAFDLLDGPLDRQIGPVQEKLAAPFA